MGDLHRSASVPIMDTAIYNNNVMGPTYNQSQQFIFTTALPTNTNIVMSSGYPGLQHFRLEYEKYHGYIAAVVCIWGIVANLANIIVLTRKNMHSSTNLILMWLAVADLMTMTSYFPVSIHFYIMKDPSLHFPSSTSQAWIYFML